MVIKIDRAGYAEECLDRTVSESLVTMDMGRHMAMYYAPVTPTEQSGVAVVMMHCDQNYMAFPMAAGLARRGYQVLAADSWVGGEIDRKLEHVGKLVRYLRSRCDVDKVLLMGHSGGATLMSAYQAVAENGPEIFRRSDMIYPCTVREKLEPADGIMLIDANYGNAVMSIISLDPAVVQEGCGTRLDPKYDIFDPKNGYAPDGAHYLPGFIRMYQRAQAKRNQALIDHAMERLRRIDGGEGDYTDDEPMIIAAADQPKPNNRLLPEDLRLLSHTKGVYPLLHGDGSVTHEQIRCLRTPECDRSFSMTYGMGANKNTVRGFLSSQAIRTTDDFAVTENDVCGVEWDSSYASPVGNIRYVHIPALLMGMTGSYEYLATEMIYNRAPMEDKTIAFVRGATHNFFPNRDAEKLYGPFGDTEGALYDYMAQWMRKFI